MPMVSKHIIRFIIMVIGLLPAQLLAEDWYASVGVSSNYVWRGVSQTGGGAAVSGGIEFVDVNNVYVGAWVSNTNLGPANSYAAEVDLYMGVSGKSEEIGYDMGYIAYQYPGNSGLSFEEFYAAISVGGFTIKGSDSTTNGSYLEGNVKFRFPSKRKIYVNLHVGRYNHDLTQNYFDASVGIHINELTFNVSYNDIPDDSLKVYIVWEHTVDF